MDKLSKALFGTYLLLALSGFVWLKQAANLEKESEDKLRPYEFFDYKRSYPDLYPDVAAYRSVVEQIASTAIGPVKSNNPFSDQWNVEGPGNIGGRINCIAVHPTNSNIIFTGTPAGGIFKTVNGGTTWTPVFDDQAQLSIATIVFDPVNPTIMYAGTGDPNISGDALMGNGIYKSIDGGNSWNYLGLAAASIITKIKIHPTNPQIIYAASMGIPHTATADRGLYKSSDGGQTWQNVLFISNDAGIIDLVMDPTNPQILYASGWNRLRNNQQGIIVGQASKIFKTTDGGQNWAVLTNGLPAPGLSRVNIDILPSNPQTLYASFIDTTFDVKGLFKTTNGGANWAPVDTFGLPPNACGGFGWYFGHIKVNPYSPNQLFFLGVDLWKTDDGQNWDYGAPQWWTYNVHADKHDIVFIDANTFLLATDGGLYKTEDGGFTWDDIDIIPNSQFYHVAYNPFDPQKYWGGMQDNGTSAGNSSVFAQWPRIYGGDGFMPEFDPDNADLFYCETQNGNIVFTDDGGNNWMGLDNTLMTDDRRAWDMPYFLSKTENQTLYTGSYRVFRMTGAPYGQWEPISPDLTDGIDDMFHTISTVAQSPLNADYLYAGTCDANVWRSIDNGVNWEDITGNLPNRYVTRIVTSPNNANTVYVTHSGYKYNDSIPHIHKSINKGTTWIDISGDMPQTAVNDILPIKNNDSILFVATDAGVYGTVNMGVNWHRVGTNMPTLIVEDIDYNPTTNRLIAGTYARSVMTFPLDKILLSLNMQQAELPVTLYPNPANDIINISMPTVKSVNDVVITLFNTAGQMVSAERIDNGKNISLDTSILPTGQYFFVAQVGKSRVVKRFLKS